MQRLLYLSAYFNINELQSDLSRVTFGNDIIFGEDGVRDGVPFDSPLGPEPMSFGDDDNYEVHNASS